MPTFDFRCQKCQTVFEFARPFGSKENPSCPACKSTKTEKLLTPPAVVFKGAGWYKTDSTVKPRAESPKEPDTAPSEKKESADAPSKPPKAETEKKKPKTEKKE